MPLPAACAVKWVKMGLNITDSQFGLIPFEIILIQPTLSVISQVGGHVYNLNEYQQQHPLC